MQAAHTHTHTVQLSLADTKERVKERVKERFRGRFEGRFKGRVEGGLEYSAWSSGKAFVEHQRPPS